MSTQVERYESVVAELSRKSIYDQIDARKLAFAKSRMPGLTDVEVGAALELAGTLGLNVWAGEFFASKKDGKLFMMVGRDGLLRKAEEFPDYRGYDSGVVHENDVFYRGNPDPDGKTMRERAGVVHRMEHPAKQGAVIGAWAVAERAGRPTRFFYAPLAEYMPTSEGKLKYSPWGNSVSVMIEKVPISIVHRTICNLSGVYLPEEVDKAAEGGGETALTIDEELDRIKALVDGLEFVAPEDADDQWAASVDKLRDALWEGIKRANTMSPYSRGLAWAQMTLPGRTAEQLHREVQWLDEQFPVEDEPEDAVVVEDDTIVAPRPEPSSPGSDPAPSSSGSPTAADPANAEQVNGADTVSHGTDTTPVEPVPLPCPVCGRSWLDHSDVEQAACSAKADLLEAEGS